MCVLVCKSTFFLPRLSTALNVHGTKTSLERFRSRAKNRQLFFSNWFRCTSLRVLRGRWGNECFHCQQNWASTITAARYTDKPTSSSRITRQYPQADKLTENKPTIVTSPQSRREQQHYLSAIIIPLSFGIPEAAMMSSLRVYLELESRYNALVDLSNRDGHGSSFNRTNPEPIYRRSNWFWDALNANIYTLQYITRTSLYIMHRRYDYCRYWGRIASLPAITSIPQVYSSTAVVCIASALQSSRAERLPCPRRGTHLRRNKSLFLKALASTSPNGVV